jgi:hypothetical protein
MRITPNTQSIPIDTAGARLGKPWLGLATTCSRKQVDIKVQVQIDASWKRIEVPSNLATVCDTFNSMVDLEDKIKLNFGFNL